jgi:flavodoxin
LKGIVVYDTYYGNTKIVAEAIAEQLKAEGYEAELRSVKEDLPTSPQGDIIFVGSPVRMGGPTGRMKRYVKRLDKEAWKDKPVVAFVTVGMMPKEPADEKKKQGFDKWALGGGRKLRDLAKAKGLNANDNFLWVEVKESQGPLVETGVDKTKQFTHEILTTLKK